MPRSHEELIDWFNAYEEATFTDRQNAERDRDYYDGKHWTDTEIAELRKRGQPVTTFNRIAPKVDFVLGSEVLTRTDPKAFPRTPNEEEGAEAATDAVRFVLDDNEWDGERSDCYGDFLIEGTTGCDVRVEPTFERVPTPEGLRRVQSFRIVVERVPWDRIFWDPHSRYLDFRDARYYGIVIWLDEEVARQRWPNAPREAWDFNSDLGERHAGETTQDRPAFDVWSQNVSGKRRNRVKVVRMNYWDEGEWYTATFTRGAIVEPRQVSPYVDEDGVPVPGLILQSAKMDRDNRRYGTIRHLISPQDEVNKRRSKSLHLLNVRQTRAEQGAVDVPRMKQELARPDGHVEVKPGMEFDILPTGDMAQGHLVLLNEAKQEIDAIGANAALTGKDERRQSGRALQARQQGGFVELEPIFDAMRRWQVRIFRAVWMRVRQFWSEPMMLRVTDDERNIRFVGLNQPVTMAQVLQDRGVQLPPPEMLSPELIEQLSTVVAVSNDVAKLDVDIKIEHGPDLVTLQGEQFEQVANMVRAGLPIPPEIIIRLSALRSDIKKQLLELLRTGGLTPEQQQQQQAQQQQQQQLQQASQQLTVEQQAADVQETQAKAAKASAEAQQTLEETQQSTLGALFGPVS